MNLEKKELLMFLLAKYEEDDEDFEDTSSSSSSSSSDESDTEQKEQQNETTRCPLQIASSKNRSISQEQPKSNSLAGAIDGFDDDEFKNQMGLKRSTVNYVIARLTQSQPDETTSGKPKLGATTNVYMYIWYMTHTISFSELANLFGVAKSSAWHSVRRVTACLISMGHEFLSWPKGARVPETCGKFEQIKKMQGVIGAIDCTHISINAPRDGKESYCNRQESYSLILQAVADADHMFTNVYCGEPGSCRDSLVLKRSELYAEVQSNYTGWFPKSTFLLGDSAYAPSSWLVPPYTDDGDLTDTQHSFNNIHACTRTVVDTAIRLLKGRFPRLNRFTEQRDMSAVTNLVVSACILHNVCLSKDDLWEKNEPPEETAPEVVDENNSIDETDQNDNRRDKLLNYLLEKSIL